MRRTPARYRARMSETIRSAFGTWPHYNERLRAVVEGLSDVELAIQPSSGRWPLWATIGHTACQRVFWLCDFAGEPGAETTPFTNAAFDCPGDDDLEHVLGAAALVDAIDATFRIVERCLGTWTFASLDDEISHREWDDSWVHTRGWVIQRVYSHDVSHCTELNETLGRSAGALADRFGLRGFDAIHLASFQELLTRADDEDVRFSSADARLARAAMRLG